MSVADSLAVPIADTGSRAGVLLPLPLAGAYDYAFPQAVRRGQVVLAPLGKREVLGVVWGPAEGSVAPEKLRTANPIKGSALPESLCDFIDWVARYTLNAPGAVLALALRAEGAFGPEIHRRALVLANSPLPALQADLPRKRGRKTVMHDEHFPPSLAGEVSSRVSGETEGAHAPQPARISKARERVIALMKDGLARMPSEIAELAGVGPSVAKGLAESGALAWTELPEFARAPVPNPDHAKTALNEDQLRAAKDLQARVRAHEFSTVFLDGVTGSGKTEVYFEAAAEALASGRQVLILLPEIALTVQFLDRFASRFGCRPMEWHSGLSSRERRRVYRAVLSGEARVVAGARSALFLPFPSLGLIVADEEHDQAYKQEDGVIYHARDMAVVRARLEKCPVVLASATPSLETYTNAKSGRYTWLRLARRFGAAEMPEVRLIDLRAERGEAGQYLSPPLREALTQTLAAGEQALLFLNRRGYAPLTLCGQCGRKETCVNCAAWMVEHRRRKKLVCHHCAYETPIPRACAQCGAADSLIACGPGVERIDEEFRAAFPDARVAIASSDTFDSPLQARTIIRALEAREIDAVIGTQIVAKGHHFPQLTLAGIIDADLGGGTGDMRAAERSFQLLHQVAGRSGRGGKPGLVLIQTRNPDDPVMRTLAANDRDAFLDAESRERERSLTPPFGRLAALILSGADADAVRETGRKLASAAPRARGVTVWGPAPAFYQVLRGKTRERLLVQTEKNIDIQGYLRAWLGETKIPAAVRLAVDIDPISFF